MTEKQKDSVPEPDWLAIAEGDKAKAHRYMLEFAGKLLGDQPLTRIERHRLASALIAYCGDPVAFFGHGRRGPSATKTDKKIEIWQAVRTERESLKKNKAKGIVGGEQLVDVYAKVASNQEMNDRTVREWYEQVQRHLKQYEKHVETTTSGIAALLP